MIDLLERTKGALEELIPLAEKMPRDELVKAVPPEKFLQFLRAFLNCDPYGDELREQVYEQSKLVDEIENPHIEMDQNGKPKSEVSPESKADQRKTRN
jgi:hypothetical protein